MIVDARELCIGDLKGQCRALCIDYGDRRVGVAVSDINWVIASPLVVLESHGVYPRLLQLVGEYEVGVLVIGLPKALNGGASGKQLQKVNKFAAKLDELKHELYLVFWDERQSTNGAIRILERTEEAQSKYKNKIDKVAASFILEGFMQHCNRLYATNSFTEI